MKPRSKKVSSPKTPEGRVSPKPILKKSGFFPAVSKTVESTSSTDLLAEYKKESDVNVALLAAAEEGNLTRLKQLLNDSHWESASEGEYEIDTEPNEFSSINIDVKDKKGRTPLMLAIINNHFNCAVYLYEQDADFDKVRDDIKHTALEYASHYMKDFYELVRPAKIRLDETQNTVQSAAELLSMELSEQRFDKILEQLKAGATKGANSHRLNDVVNDEGMTALMFALEQDNVPEKLILQMCNDPDLNLTLSDNAGNTSLHWACIKNNKMAVIALAAKSQEFINQRDKEGRTPLMLAAQYGETTLMRELLNYGADPGMLDHHGKNIEDYIQLSALGSKAGKRMIIENWAPRGSGTRPGL